MQKAEKKNDSPARASHCFPNLQCNPARVSQDHTDPGDCFRPSFQINQTHTLTKGLVPADRHDGGNDKETLARIQKESFDKGVAAANGDACAIAQKEVAPALDRFAQAHGDLSQCFNQITHDHGNLIIDLAMAIAKKVLGVRSGLSADQINPIDSELKLLLQQHYQLILNLGDEDRAALSDLLTCQNLQLVESNAVRFTKKAGTPAEPGEPTVEIHSREILQERLSEKMTELLSGAESPP